MYLIYQRDIEKPGEKELMAKCYRKDIAIHISNTMADDYNQSPTVYYGVETEEGENIYKDERTGKEIKELNFAEIGTPEWIPLYFKLGKQAEICEECHAVYDPMAIIHIHD